MFLATASTMLRRYSTLLRAAAFAIMMMQIFGRKLYELEKVSGIHGPESVEAVGANAKVNEFCAATGRVQPASCGWRDCQT